MSMSSVGEEVTLDSGTFKCHPLTGGMMGKEEDLVDCTSMADSESPNWLPDRGREGAYFRGT